MRSYQSLFVLSVILQFHCILTCDFDNGEYLTWNGSCTHTCNPPHFPKTIKNINICDICPLNHSYSSDGTCVPDAGNTIQNQDHQVKSVSLDTLCPEDQYLYQNGSCLEECPASYVKTYLSGSKRCYKSCGDHHEFLYQDGSCRSRCPFPLIKKTHSSHKFCENPCQSNEHLLWNSSCTTTCNSLYTSNLTPGGSVCLHQCPDKTHFLFSNGSCYASCPSSLVQTSYGDIKLCHAPCRKGEYRNWDQTCTQDCTSPMIAKIDENDNYICQSPCENASDYFNEEKGTCQTKCEEPYIVREHGSFKSCVLKHKMVHSQARMLSEAPEFITKIGRDVTDIFITIGSTLGSSNPATFTLAGFVKMVPYIRYIDVQYPPRLEAVLDNLRKPLISFAFGPTVPDVVVNTIPKQTIPWKFEKYQLHSSFLVNYWQTMMSLGIVLTIIFTLALLYWLTRKMGPLHSLFEKLQLIVKWNFFLMIFCSNLDEVALYTSLELRSLHLDSAGSIVGFTFCIIANLVVLGVFTLIILIVRDVMKSKRQVHPKEAQNLMSRWENFQLLFKGSKSDSLLQQIFMLPFLGRVYLFNLSIAYLFEHPLIQAIFTVSLNVLMVLYMTIKKPFVSKVVYYQHVSDELNLLAVNICLLILAIFDHNGSDDIDTRAALGDAIIIVNIILSFSSLFFLVLYIIQGIQSAFKTIKSQKVKGMISILLVFLAPFEVGGMDMELLPVTEVLSSPKATEETENLQTDMDFPTSTTRANNFKHEPKSPGVNLITASGTRRNSTRTAGEPTLNNLDQVAEGKSGNLLVVEDPAKDGYTDSRRVLKGFRERRYSKVRENMESHRGSILSSSRPGLPQ